MPLVGSAREGSLDEIRIALTDAASRLNFFFEHFHLGEQHCRLQRVQPTIDAESRMMIATVLAVHANFPHGLCRFVIVREQCAAIAIRAQRLRWEKRGRADIRYGTRTLASIKRTEALRRVFDHRQSMLAGELIDGIEVRALSI
jgi:hypothetical protein